ncbi:MAG: phenylalanine--tRNA ligase subunit beta [Bacteroidota bacterium]
MRISLNWLQEYISLPESPEEIARLLTQSGLEVGNIEPLEPIKGSLQGLLIGQVIACEQHPHADKLKKTRVDIGDSRPLTIICGAPNVQIGQKVIIAPVGTKIHSYTGKTFKIKQAKIKGEVSEGMICAEDEIGLGPSHEGILVLDTSLLPGTPAIQYFDEQRDTIFTIELTPNRADACSHIGVARELRAILDRPIQFPAITQLQEDAQTLPIQVKIDDHTTCPRYSGIVISGVKVQASPPWLQNKLKAIGIHPTNNIIDVTNVITHELGQPLHAFDYDQIAGKEIQVKSPKEGKSLVTLDGVTRNLTGRELMISDQAGDIAMAGVLGGKRTSISQGTQSIFLESAYFSPTAVRKTAQQHDIKTEAAFRFERGTDPNITVYALQRACFLIQGITQGTTTSAVIDSYPTRIENSRIKVYYKNITRLVGQAIPPASIQKILNNLDIALSEAAEDSFIAIVPPYRVDVTREVDIIEEILRIYGYGRIEAQGQLGSIFLAEKAQPVSYKIAALLAANGYHEIYTNSLTSSDYGKLTKTLDEAHNVCILNPLSERLDILRQTLIFSGLEVIAHNMNRQQTDLKLFEFGKTYHKDGNRYVEYNRLGIWLTGNLEAPNWISKPRAVTFQDLNATLYKILYRLGIVDFASEPITNACYETSVQLTFKQKPLVTAGILSQSLLQHAGINQPVFFADIAWDKLWGQSRPELQYQAISRFPAVKRDLSLVLDQSITFEAIKNLIKQQKEALIQDVFVFDVYEGGALSEGKKAYALTFVLQGKDKTLDDKRIHKVMIRLIHAFEKQLGAIIRE